MYKIFITLTLLCFYIVNTFSEEATKFNYIFSIDKDPLNSQIYIADKNFKNIKMITDSKGTDYQDPSYISTLKKIVTRMNNSKIILLDPYNYKEEIIINDADYDNFDPILSFDMKNILFIRQSKGKENNTNRTLCIYNLDSKKINIVKKFDNNSQFAISVDSKLVSYDENNSIYFIENDGKNIRKIYEFPKNYMIGKLFFTGKNDFYFISYRLVETGLDANLSGGWGQYIYYPSIYHYNFESQKTEKIGDLNKNYIVHQISMKNNFELFLSGMEVNRYTGYFASYDTKSKKVNFLYFSPSSLNGSAISNDIFSKINGKIVNESNADNSINVINSYYQFIQSHDFKKAYDLSPKKVNYDTFYSWYKDIKKICPIRIIIKKDKNYSLVVFLEDENKISLYDVSMKIENGKLIDSKSTLIE